MKYKRGIVRLTVMLLLCLCSGCTNSKEQSGIEESFQTSTPNNWDSGSKTEETQEQDIQRQKETSDYEEDEL